VSFQSVIYLQNNYYHQPDFLYPYPLPSLLPIFSISRSGNLTEDKFHELYDPLVMGLKAKEVAVSIGIGMTIGFGCLCICAVVCLVRKCRAAPRSIDKDSQLTASQDPQRGSLIEVNERLVLEHSED
jgi:hypothetical protein